MNRIRNNQKIKQIIMKPAAFTKCELGQDWYENKLEIIFYPDEYYPDYTEVQNWIMENIDGKEMNIEDVIMNIYSFLQKGYRPKSLKIIDYVENCRTHFDVIVER